MILSARFLNSVGSVNDFAYVQQAQFVEGDQLDVYFQLTDLAKPGNLRYMPAAGATLSVTVDNIDDARKITRPAVQPFPLDPSIWKVSILSGDGIKGTQNLILNLSEGGVLKHGLIKAAFRVQSASCV
jgi:hypothetical protein